MSYVVRRLLQMVPVVVLVVVLVFLLIHLVPGDPARTLLGPRAPESVVQQVRHELGLDRPLPVQFGRYVDRLAHGDLGRSISYGIPATELIGNRVLPTLMLVLYAALLAIVITLPLASLAAIRANRLADHMVRAIPLVGLGMPSFWVGLLLILLLAIRTGWFPVGGYGDGLLGHLRALFLPGLTVALSIAPFTIRSLRAAMLEVLDSDYIATARAKGISEAQVLVHHALRNAVIPTVTVLGVNIGWLVGNTLIIEKVFAIPGLGALMVDSILERDFPTVQALTLIFGMFVVAVNLTTDLLRASLDPRVKLA